MTYRNSRLTRILDTLRRESRLGLRRGRVAVARGRRRLQALRSELDDTRFAATARAAWRSKPSRALRRAAPWAVGAVAVVVFLAGATGLGLAAYQGASLTELPLAPDNCPTRVYASPVQLSAGEALDLDELEAHLTALRYHPARERIANGTYWRAGDRIAVGVRQAPVASEHSIRSTPFRLDLRVEDGSLAAVLVDGAPFTRPVTLEPLEIAAVADDSMVDCRPVYLGELPRHVVQSILAAEDDGFFDHAGISPEGILRAAWVNATAGQVRQGGSTLTQQLVKNLYLSSERTFTRKAQEAVLAVAVETRFDKENILTAYLNRAYWGSRDARQLVGIGAAARAWFDKEAEELDLHESALLAAMIRSPGAYDPLRNSERALARRDWVLERMHELGWIDDDEFRDALAHDVGVDPRPVPPSIAPYFVDWVVQETEARYETEVAGRGLHILTTLDLHDQEAARRAVAEGLGELDEDRDLQAALVSLDPATGAIRAWVGGREYAESEFDRVSQARRQVGSAFKPFVYAAALESGVVDPYEQVYDAPLLVVYGDDYWLPRNNDRTFRGPVPMHRALELSLNVPTVRLAIASGTHRVRDVAARVGLVRADAEALPSFALGTAQASPLALARAYSVFASEGYLPTPTGVVAVTDADGPLAGRGVPSPTRVLDAETARTMNAMLQEVVTRGTGSALRRARISGPVAGKTGTSDDQRDTWFAGFVPGRTTVVWIGRDDDRSTGYYGSQAALPIWGAFNKAARRIDAPDEWPSLERLRLEQTRERRPGETGETTGGETEPILRPMRFDWTPAHMLWAARDRRPDVAAVGWDTLMPSYRYGDRPEPGDPWEDFLARLHEWQSSSVSAGTVRVFEVPASFRFPCADARQSAVVGNPCAESAIGAG